MRKMGSVKWWKDILRWVENVWMIEEACPSWLACMNNGQWWVSWIGWDVWDIIFNFFSNTVIFEKHGFNMFMKLIMIA